MHLYMDLGANQGGSCGLGGGGGGVDVIATVGWRDEA